MKACGAAGSMFVCAATDRPKAVLRKLHVGSRTITQVRDPTNFEQSLHFTETVSSFDKGPMSVATAPWRLGRLTGSTTEKARASLAPAHRGCRRRSKWGTPVTVGR